MGGSQLYTPYTGTYELEVAHGAAVTFGEVLKILSMCV